MADQVLIDKLLQAVVKEGASDLHITVGQPPVVRLHGRMQKLKTKVLEPADTMAPVKSIAPDRCQQELQTVGGSDFGFAFGDAARFRVSIFKQRGTVAMVLRQIPNKLLTMDELGLPKACEQLIKRPRGLFLVTGPTGSGKSTSPGQHDQLFERDRGSPHHYGRRSDRILSLQQEMHRQSAGDRRRRAELFRSLRRALRQDPDVILVGELRDLATIEAAISAAETGHVVFGTLHTNSAQGTVNRIIDVFPTNQQDQIRTQLSTSIIGVLAQGLVPKIGGGRIACYEMLVVTPAIGNLIRENKTFRITSAIQTGAKYGMILMDDSLFNLWPRKSAPRRRC